VERDGDEEAEAGGDHGRECQRSAESGSGSGSGSGGGFSVIEAAAAEVSL